MRQRVEYRVGPGMTSLLMVLMVLCLATLAILAYASMRVDSTLTEKSVATTVAYYQAEETAQSGLYQLDRMLSEKRAEAQGDADAYIEGVREALDLSGEDAGTGPLVHTMQAALGDGRVLRVTVEIPRSLEGPRYQETHHQVVNDAPWEAEENIGFYVPAVSDDDDEEP